MSTNTEHAKAICHLRRTCSAGQLLRRAPWFAWGAGEAAGICRSTADEGICIVRTWGRAIFAALRDRPCSITSRGEFSPGQIDVQIATLDDPGSIVPEAQIHLAERIGWVDELDLDGRFDRYRVPEDERRVNRASRESLL
jgi:hypothetical protein